jgi:oxygen-dependent protoporphyrinogen oxidase
MRIAILGAGISGLSAAWQLRKKHPHAQIAIFEAQADVGGWIQSRTIGPFLFELGPRTFPVSRSQALLQLVREVGLEQEIILSHREARRRYLLHRGKLRPVSAFWPLMLSMAVRDIVMPRAQGREETLYEFAARRFGVEAAEQFFDPMARGVFGGDARCLSLQACFPFFATWEREHRSILWAALRQPKQQEGLFTLRRGMQSLCHAIVKRGRFEVYRSTPVERMGEKGVWAGGAWFAADQVVAALPARTLAALLDLPVPVSSVPLHVVALGYTNAILPLCGYGYLAPSREREDVLGVIFDSAVFPTTPGQVKVTAMVRSTDPLQAALEAAARLLGLSHPPDAYQIAATEIPQYEIGHQRRIEEWMREVHRRYPRLQVCGNYFYGASVNSCIDANRSTIIAHRELYEVS